MPCCVVCTEILVNDWPHKEVVIFTFLKFKLMYILKHFHLLAKGLVLYLVSMEYLENSEALTC